MKSTILPASLFLVVLCRVAPAESYHDRTLKGWTEWAEVTVVAKRIEPAKKPPVDGQKVICEIVDVIKSDDPAIKPGTKIVHTHRCQKPWRPQMATGTLIFFKGERKRRGDNTSTLRWWPQANASHGLAKYVSDAPATKGPQKKRLRYFYRFLEHAEEPIAADAFKEFEHSFMYHDDKEFLSAIGQLKLNRLRKIIDNPKTPPKRKNFYGLMLGLRGTPKDAAILKRHVSRLPAEFVEYRYYLLMGYLLLAGEDGLDYFDRTRLSGLWLRDEKGKLALNKEGEKQKLSEVDVYLTVYAIEQLERFAPERIPRQRRLKSIRRLLNTPSLIGIAIETLTAWRDWEVQDRLMQLYRTGKLQDPRARRDLAHYLVRSAHDRPKGGKPEPEHAKKARRYLEIMRKKDSEFVERAEEFWRTLHQPIRGNCNFR